MRYSTDYTELSRRLRAGERVKVRFTRSSFRYIAGTHYGEMYEDDSRYFITSRSAGLKHYELCLARNKYTADLHKEFARIKIEFKNKQLWK